MHRSNVALRCGKVPVAASEIRFRRSDDEPTRHVRNDTFYFDYKGPLPAGNKVKVDVTRGETVVFALERKSVLGTYDEFSDLPNATSLQVYSFPEIIVEKTLAITDGARRGPNEPTQSTTTSPMRQASAATRPPRCLFPLESPGQSGA